MLNMTPPKPSKQRFIVPTSRILLTKDTGVSFTLDLEDWMKAKEVVWYQRKGKIVNQQGTDVRVYLGIEHHQLMNPNIFDYRRLK